MLSFLQDIDSRIFLTLNDLHVDFLDQAMYLISSKWLWVPFYVLLLFLVYRRCNLRQTILCLAAIAIAITLSDQICASLIRPIVCRPRPAHPDSPISHLVYVVNEYRGGHYGFPSCHAANSAALATFMVLFFRNRLALWGFTAWTLLLCYSRIYLGVHYPGDLLVGLIIGSIVGFLCFKGFNFLRNRTFFSGNTAAPPVNSGTTS